MYNLVLLNQVDFLPSVGVGDGTGICCMEFGLWLVILAPLVVLFATLPVLRVIVVVFSCFFVSFFFFDVFRFVRRGLLVIHFLASENLRLLVLYQLCAGCAIQRTLVVDNQ